MEKRTGWGAEYADDMRNGEWEYQAFKSDKSVNDKANLKNCFTCHKPLDKIRSAMKPEAMRLMMPKPSIGRQHHGAACRTIAEVGAIGDDVHLPASTWPHQQATPASAGDAIRCVRAPSPACLVPWSRCRWRPPGPLR